MLPKSVPDLEAVMAPLEKVVSQVELDKISLSLHHLTKISGIKSGLVEEMALPISKVDLHLVQASMTVLFFL
ncbi:hypothetical protein WICPIJ_007410 [Wickerhamomyces pijperi]|uniref:Uncharacterized protein n=1 Tax=Wickerhamomyces pijperi TaxID=599730 RepID=A0A9P8TK40_WICPI|nr:hypothetical protein WICPIJ_007410 [Wickerhamomyces pijperi]